MSQTARAGDFGVGTFIICRFGWRRAAHSWESKELCYTPYAQIGQLPNSSCAAQKSKEGLSTTNYRDLELQAEALDLLRRWQLMPKSAQQLIVSYTSTIYDSIISFIYPYHPTRPRRER